MHLISNKRKLIVLSFIQSKDGYELIKTAISALYQFRALTIINTTLGLSIHREHWLYHLRCDLLYRNIIWQRKLKIS